jgi:hypothetical protein
MNLSDLQHDPHNANRGTPRGRKTLATSLQQFGAGRSILVDKDGIIIAGNKTAEQAAAAGINDIILVPTDGTELVVVQRTDLSMDDPKSRGLAIADNRVSEVGLQWDSAILGELATEMDLKPFFTDAELTGTEEQDAGNAENEWEGMPEACNENVAKRHLTIHFHSEQNVQDFADLIQQTITSKTKYVWYPQEQSIVAKATKYVINE